MRRPRITSLLLLCIVLSTCPAAPAAAALRDTAPTINHRYVQIVILSPRDQDTVFDNAGHVDIVVLMSPATTLEAVERVELYLDGRPAGAARPTPTGFAIDGITRGGHWLQVRIADASGSTVIASAPVRFFMWQASRLFPGRG